MLSFSFFNDSRCSEARHSNSCTQQHDWQNSRTGELQVHSLSGCAGLHNATDLHLSIKGFPCTLLFLLSPLPSSFLLLECNMCVQGVEQGPLAVRNPPLTKRIQVIKLRMRHALQGFCDCTMGR